MRIAAVSCSIGHGYGTPAAGDSLAVLPHVLLGAI
jgi:hypothetical protein